MSLGIIDRWLDRVTMYRLMIYYLLLILAAAVGSNLLGYSHYQTLGIIFSAAYLSLICWIINEVFGWAFETPSNPESAIITGLILSLIITPYKIPHDLLFLTAAGGLAIASKYILAIRGKHIFNPAAIAVALTALGANQVASWWVGTKYLAPFVIIGGWLVVRKIEREYMVLAFLVSSLGLSVLIVELQHRNLGLTLKNSVLQSSLMFLAFAMLTEPASSPTTKRRQWLYGALTGLLWPPQVHLFSFYSTPERALVIGNLFSYLVSPKAKLLPKLQQKIRASKSVVDFVFTANQPVAYEPGQYMEWTVRHKHSDSRGYRRYFTLASSPTESNIRVGVKFFPDGSSYKKALLELDENSKVAASQLGGSFTLPADQSRKLAFIAGGIGVTPYRSMLKYLVDKNEQRDVVLLYSENTADEIAYHDVFEAAHKQLGAKILYTLSKSAPQNWNGLTGMVSSEMISQQIPDYKERLFYISGPQPMVQAIKRALKELGLPAGQIKTDYFPGYA